MPYTASHPPVPSSDELRDRIPGWGADLDHADRPSVPQEIDALAESGAWWDEPEHQKEEAPRERSIEHERLPAVFGTAQPLRGLSGAIRRYAYGRFSEARAAHWLLLIGADRVEATGAHLRSLATARPDNPVTETGIAAELRHSPLVSRKGRVDTRHAWIDPLLVAGPWLAGGLAVVWVARRALRRR